jgi:flagellar basal-body rod modification protein FlgD
MATIDAYGGTSTVTGSTTAATGTSLVNAPVGTNPDGILGKDDFMKLLLVELQYQDPTEPMDSEKILTQTSQLATLESSSNTNKALTDLTTALGSSQQYSAIAAIGKTADLGSNGIALDTGVPTSFEIYFPNDVKSGNVNIMDVNGNIIRELNVAENPKGTYIFDWDGKDSVGADVDSGVYYVESKYTDSNDKEQLTRVGAYPIESVRFEGGSASVKLGSSYVPFDQISEIY